MNKKLQAAMPRTPGLGRRQVVGLLTAGVGAVALGWPVRRGHAAAMESGLDSLVKAAQKEGTLTYYTGLTENVCKRMNEAFNNKYGVKAEVIVLTGAQVAQRYSAEATAGNIAADVVILSGGADALSALATDKGWMEPVSSSGLPVLASGEFPARMNLGKTAIVNIAPWLVGYNTDKVKGADIPRDYTDLLNPKWKGQVIVNDPANSDAYVEFWSAIVDNYGAGFFEKLRPNIRPVGGPSQQTQALGAGEGAFAIPQVSLQLQLVRAKGAPVDSVMMDLTTGVQNQVMLTARPHSKHPNAGRLFANWCMSLEGNKVINADPGAFTVYDTANLPKRYVVPKPGVGARREELRKLLGFA
jgi:iron(III) transport system substrate-binding protein